MEVSNECKIREGALEDPVSTDKIDENMYEEFFTYCRVPKVDRLVRILDLGCLKVNPNSYKTVQHVLYNILTYIDNTHRKYVVIVIDGAPYCLAIKLLRSIHICSVYGASEYAWK